MKIEVDKIYNCDCIDVMKSMQEQGIVADWCITDPPYGIGYTDMTGGGNGVAKRIKYDKTWDDKKIDKTYFDSIFKVSKSQIIFGGNYYTDILPTTKSWIVWDKRCEDKYRNDFADCELAWCSQGVARVFRYLYQGMLQGNMRVKDARFHPTQKPVAIWIQLLNYYTKEGDLILDTFGGSCSLAIACHKLKRHYIVCEKDKEYYDKGTKWLESVKSQISMFD